MKLLRIIFSVFRKRRKAKDIATKRLAVEKRALEIGEIIRNENERSVMEIANIAMMRCVEREIGYTKREIKDLENRIEFHKQEVKNGLLTKGEELLEKVIMQRLTEKLLELNRVIQKQKNLLQSRDLIFI